MSTPILMLHSIAPTGPEGLARWQVTPWRLAAHLVALAEEGYTPVSLQQVVAARDGAPLPRRPYAVTVDDGFADFAHEALPVLELLDVPSTVLVTTGYVDGRAEWLAPLGAGDVPMMSAADIAALPDHVEVGAHGHTHAMMDLLGAGRARDELATGRATLEDIVGRPVTTVAYPHGYSTRTVRRAAAALGYRTGLAVGDRLHGHDDDPLAIARVEVRGDMEPDDLLRHLHACSTRDPLLAPVTRTAWRAVRRGTVGRQQRQLAGVG